VALVSKPTDDHPLSLPAGFIIPLFLPARDLYELALYELLLEESSNQNLRKKES